MGQMVSFKANGGTAEGYLATPAGGRGPGVVVIQEWWGLNDQIKGVADMLAREGFNALAPDFYHGTVTREPNEAGKLLMELDLARAARDGRGAARHLASHPGTSSKKVGVIGFCMGGLLALLTGAEASDVVGAVVDCYGVGKAKPDFARLRGIPVLGIFGGKDASLDPQAIAGLEKRLAEAGAPFEKKVYPDADHAFLNEQRPDVHRADDAKDAWGRIVPFLKRQQT